MKFRFEESNTRISRTEIGYQCFLKQYGLTILFYYFHKDLLAASITCKDFRLHAITPYWPVLNFRPYNNLLGGGGAQNQEFVCHFWSLVFRYELLKAI